MEQNSKLNIVVDTSNAETKIRSFNQSLKQMERNGETVARAMARIGSNVNLAGLGNGVTVAQESLRAFANTATATATAIGSLGAATRSIGSALTAMNTSLLAGRTALEQFNQAAQRVSTSARNISSSALQAQLNQDKLAISASKVAREAARAAEASTRAQIAVAALAAANSRADAAMLGAAAAASRAAAAISNEAAAAARAAAAASNAAGASDRAAAAAVRLAAAEARAAADADRLAGGLGRANAQSRGLMGTMQSLQGALMGGLGGIASLGVLKTADAMQNLNSQIRNVTESEHEYLSVKLRLKTIADQNYSDISATTGLYASSARALANLGKSQSDALEFTNAVSLAMRTGGRSASEQASAIMQLGQAMGSNVVQGDEFRSISENAPILLELVAKRLGVLPGQLKALAADGKITGEVMFDAMTQNVDILEEMAKKMPLTMSQAFEVAKNNYKRYVDGMMNETGGMSGKIASMISGISANFDTMAKVSIAAIGLAFLNVVTSVNLAARAMAIFNAVTSANPVLLIAGSFLILSSAIFGTNEVLTVSGLIMSDFFAGTKNMIDDASSWWREYSSTVAKQLGIVSKNIDDSNSKNIKSFWTFNKSTEQGFAGLVQHIATNLSGVTALFGTFFKLIENWVRNALSIFDNLGRAAYNAGNTVRKFFGGSDNSVGYVPYANRSLSPTAILTATYESNANAIQKKAQGWNRDAGVTPKEYNTPLSARSRYAKGFDFSNALNRNTGQGVLKRQLPGAPSSLLAPVGQLSNQPINADKAMQALLLKQQEATEANTIALNTANKKQEALERKSRSAARSTGAGGKPKDTLVGISGASGNVTGAHLDIRYANSKAKVRPEHLARFKADGKPLSAFPVTSGYGRRTAPKAGASSNHVGIDYGMKSGTPITTNVPIKSVKTYASGNGAGNISLVTFEDGVAIKLLHQAPSALKIKNGSRTGNSEYDNAINTEASDAQRAADEAVKIAQRKYEEMLALQDKLFDEYANEKQKQEKKLDIRLDEIAASGFSDETKSGMIIAAKKEMDSALAIYEEGFDRQLSQLAAYKKTERDILEENRRNEQFDADNNKELMRPENADLLVAVKAAIDRKYDYELLVYNNTIRKQSNELMAYQKTERQIMLDGWDDKIADASFATDELYQLRMDSLYAERDRETELFDLNQSVKMLELRKSHLTEMQYIREKYKLEQFLINNSKESPELKNQQSVNNSLGMMQAGKEVQDRVKGAYDKQTRGLYGEGEGSFNLSESFKEQWLIASKAFDEGVIQLEEYHERLNLLDEQYIDNKKVLILDGHQAIFGNLAGLMKGFIGEQNFAYRALYAVQKAYTFSSALLSSKKVIMDAWETPGGFIAKTLAVGKAVLATSEITSAIAGLSPKGFKQGGYTGNGGVNEIAGVAHGQEYVFDAQSTKRIGVNNLDAMRSGQSVGSGDVNINVNVDAKGNANVAGDNDKMGREMANGIKAVVMDVMRKEKRQGGMLYA